VGDEVHGMLLVRRAMREHRFVVLPLLIALGINVVVFAVGVYPLSQRVANIEHATAPQRSNSSRHNAITPRRRER
jgi:hypothetical protein